MPKGVVGTNRQFLTNLINSFIGQSRYEYLFFCETT